MKEELIKLLENCGYTQTRVGARAKTYGKVVSGNLIYSLEVVLNVKPKIAFRVRNTMRTLEHKDKTVGYDEATDIIKAFDVLAGI